MWPYLLVFFGALAVDTIPVFAPPAWIVLVILIVKLKLNPWLTVIIGVVGSTIGRYILTRYITKSSSRLVNRKEDANLRYIGGKIGKAKWSASIFVSSIPSRRFPRPRFSLPSRWLVFDGHFISWSRSFSVAHHGRRSRFLRQIRQRESE